jgi:hypothetical protein
MGTSSNASPRPVSLASDGRKACIPSLKHKIGDNEVTVNDNEGKSNALAKTFFPPKPAWNNVEVRTKYLQPCHAHNRITSEQIWKQLRRLKPYKALGPDGISDIVLTKCTNILLDGLFYIYTAILEGNLQYKPWKTFTTVVLCKPRKARYDILKSYRPIVLVNTMWKVLTVVIAEQITYLTEKFQLLPKNHFEGRPGQTTTDAMHVLRNGIKTAWRKGKIVAVLFLDIEGAFPNAVLEILMHNLRKR